MPSREDGAPAPSPIELFLPSGWARSAVVLGEACPAALLPGAPAPGADAERLDLAVLAPSPDQEDDPTWVEHASTTVARQLSETGIAYVVPGRSHRLRRSLATHGLRATDMLLHVPDAEQSRHVVPLGTGAARYGVSGQLAMRPGKRAVARMLSRSGRLAGFLPTGYVFRRRCSPLAEWLFELDASPETGTALISTGAPGHRGAVVRRFPVGATLPDAVAKVSPTAPRELEALRSVAPTAARAGARVPEVRAAGALGELPLVLESALRGQVAADLLARGRLAPALLQERLATWLEAWGRLSGRNRALGRGDAERLVLSPAARLVPDERGYLSYLAKLCAAAEGTSCPFVASHGDLTSANVLLDGTADVGVVDWEEASAEALPMADFFYAAADAAAGVARFADRPAAVAACFGAGGEQAAHVGALTRRLADALGVAPPVAELCFHACWLHHAGNEAARTGVGPFGAILRSIAGAPGRYRPLPA